MTTESIAPTVDFLILADRAEAINGKLYLMGGGWDRLRVPDPKQPVSFSIAVGILAPWTATNEEYPVSIAIEDGDHRPVVSPIVARLTFGRPPGATPGQMFRAMVAVNGHWPIGEPGTYCAVIRISGQEAKRTVFYVERPQV